MFTSWNVWTLTTIELATLRMSRTSRTAKVIRAAVSKLRRSRLFLNNKIYIRLSLNESNMMPMWVSLSVCLSVRPFLPKDIDRRWTDMTLLYNVTSHRSWEGFITILGQDATTLTREIASKIFPPTIFFT